ncbi:MAG: hypothetical protein L3J59_12680 [Methylococcaceae bacterium]|nr:hypothetical protein [Methylococcaceae bacterium]
MISRVSVEASLFSQLIESLSTFDLLLADRYYTTYTILALLLKQDIPMFSDKEVAVHFLAYNLIRTNLARAAMP